MCKSTLSLEVCFKKYAYKSHGEYKIFMSYWEGVKTQKGFISVIKKASHCSYVILFSVDSNFNDQFFLKDVNLHKTS